MDDIQVEKAAPLRTAVRETLIRAAVQEDDPVDFLLHSRGELINVLVLGVGSGTSTGDTELRAKIVEVVREVWPEVIAHFGGKT